MRQIAYKQLTHLLKKYKECSNADRAEVYKEKAKEVIQYEKNMGYD